MSSGGFIALIGGETPEMPGFYPEDEYDIAGLLLVLWKRIGLSTAKTIKPRGCGYRFLSSSGVHSNRFSLVRRVFFDKAKMKVTQKLTKSMD